MRTTAPVFRLACCGLTVTALLSACGTAAPRPTPAPAAEGQGILILTSQGIDPAKDEVGLNDIIYRVTQSFSRALGGELQALGKIATIAINQDPNLKAGEFLARSAARRPYDAVVMVRVLSEKVGEGYKMSLEATFFKLRYQTEGGRRSITPVSEYRQLFPMARFAQDEGLESMPDVARRCAESLKAHGDL